MGRMIKWIPVLVLVLTLHLTLLACSAEEPSSPPSAEGTAATPTPTPVPTDTPIGAPQPAATPTPQVERNTATDSPAGTPQPPATPTPQAEVQVGAELTTEEYERAMEEILTRAVDEAESMVASVSSLDEVFRSKEGRERMQSLATSESWSDDDAEFASQYAEALLEETTGIGDLGARAFNQILDGMSRLRPPERLSDLHREYSAALGEAAQILQMQVGILKNADTEIKSRQELAAFYDTWEGTPELQLKAAELVERGDEACIALKEQLEAELEREVSFGCN